MTNPLVILAESVPIDLDCLEEQRRSFFVFPHLNQEIPEVSQTEPGEGVSVAQQPAAHRERLAQNRVTHLGEPLG